MNEFDGWIPDTRSLALEVQSPWTYIEDHHCHFCEMEGFVLVVGDELNKYGICRRCLDRAFDEHAGRAFG